MGTMVNSLLWVMLDLYHQGAPKHYSPIDPLMEPLKEPKGNADFISSTAVHRTFFGKPPQGLRLGIRAVLHQETNDPLPRGLGKSGHTV